MAGLIITYCHDYAIYSPLMPMLRWLLISQSLMSFTPLRLSFQLSFTPYYYTQMPLHITLLLHYYYIFAATYHYFRHYCHAIHAITITLLIMPHTLMLAIGHYVMPRWFRRHFISLMPYQLTDYCAISLPAPLLHTPFAFGLSQSYYAA